MDELSEWIADTEFLPILRRAVNAPKTNEAKQLMTKILPHITGVGAKVPYSNAEKAATEGHLHAMFYHFGVPSVFFTFAPDFKHNTLVFRLALPSPNNFDFPAGNGGLIEALKQKQTKLETIDISDETMRTAITMNPVAMSEMFRRISYDDVFSILFGIKPQDVSRYNTQLLTRKPGVFGLTSAAYQVNEEQGQGTTHGHCLVWANLSPHFLQLVVGIDALLNTAVTIIDTCIHAKLSPSIHVEKMLQQCEGKRAVAACLFQPHDPIKEPQLFCEDAQRVVCATGIHTHSFTCHKGKMGDRECRMCHPQCVCPSTRCVQLEGVHHTGVKGIKDYKVLDRLQPPSVNSRPCRNISRIPVRLRDNNLYYRELERPAIDAERTIQSLSQQDYRRYEALSEHQQV